MSQTRANLLTKAAQPQRLELLDRFAEANTPRQIASLIVHLAEAQPACCKATMVWLELEKGEAETEPLSRLTEDELSLVRSAAEQAWAVSSADGRRLATRVCHSEGANSSAVLLLEVSSSAEGRRVLDKMTSELKVAGQHLCRVLELVSVKRSETLQQALFAISDLSGSDRDMREMLCGIHAIIGKLMSAENVYIVRYDAERDSLRFLYYVDVADPDWPGDIDVPMRSMEHSLTWYLLRTGRALMGTTEQLRKQVPGPLVIQGPHSEDWLGVPMLRDGHPLGALVVQSYQPGTHYTSDDRTLLEFVASHVLTALERKQGKENLERQVQLRTLQLADANRDLQREIGERERAEHLQSALFQIAQLVAVDISETEFYRHVHAVVSGLINAQNFYVALLSEDGASLEFAYFVDTIEQSRPSRPLARGLSEYVLRHGKILLSKTQILDLVHRGEVTQETAELGPLAECWLGVPLVVGEKTIGLIVVQSYDEQIVYRPADEDLLSFVASQVANSLQRRRAAEALRDSYVQLKRRVEERTQELHSRNAELEIAYAKLENAQEQAIQSEKLASIGQLAAGVAHEINNPIGYVSSNLATLQGYVSKVLGAVDSYAANAARTADSSAQTEIGEIRRRFDIDFLAADMPQLITESRAGIDRVRKIIHDLKDFSRRDRSEAWVRADLHQGLESTLNIVSNELKYKAQIVKTFGDIPLIECLPSELNQVFLNILMNAGQAIKEHGIITVSTGCADGKVWIAVGDDGEGIPADVLPRIFDPFFTTKPVGSGTGLGLSISYGIVAKHHGTIEVTSVPGQGTLMRIELPVEQPK
jgi:signal transduction histidine kinase